MHKEINNLSEIFVVPGYTFFYWGFTTPKKDNEDLIKFFDLSNGKQNREIILEINKKKYSAKIRLARITTPKFKNREVVQIFYDRERGTLKALRKLFMYSYASTINKSKSDLKELMSLIHIKDNKFKIKAISKQKTDFDDMFNFMEDKGLFEYWNDSKSEKNKENFFIDFSRKWISVNELKKYNNRANVIYLLYHSKDKHLYVGKANKLRERVKKGKGRLGLAKDWDKFMFFEIDPKYNSFIEQIEALIIRTYAGILENDVGTIPIKDKEIKIVNRQLRKK